MNIDNYPKPEIPTKEYWEDDKWAGENLTELTKKYPDMWITVIDKKVFAVSKNPHEIVRKTESETGKKDFPIIFLEKGGRVY